MEMTKILKNTTQVTPLLTDRILLTPSLGILQQSNMAKINECPEFWRDPRNKLFIKPVQFSKNLQKIGIAIGFSNFFILVFFFVYRWKENGLDLSAIPCYECHICHILTFKRDLLS